MPTVDLAGQPAWTVVVVALIMGLVYLAATYLKRSEAKADTAAIPPPAPPGGTSVFENKAVEFAQQALADARVREDRLNAELAEQRRATERAQRELDHCEDRERRRGATP